jgi:hypothetical protein
MRIGKLVITFHSPVTFEVEGKWMRDVKQALHEGRKLLAVKIYKENTGTGLKDAKDFVFDKLVPKYYKEPVPEIRSTKEWFGFVANGNPIETPNTDPIEYNNK